MAAQNFPKFPKILKVFQSATANLWIVVSCTKKNHFVNLCFFFFLNLLVIFFVSFRFVSFLLYLVSFLLCLVSFRFVSACFVSFRFLFYNHPDLLVSHKNSDHDSVNASDLLMSQTGNSQGSSSASDLLMSQGAVDSKDTQCSFDIVEKKVIENLEKLFNGNTVNLDETILYNHRSRKFYQ